MKVRSYQIALGAALAGCIALGAVTGYLLYQRKPGAATMRARDVDPVIASGPAASEPGTLAVKESSAGAEPALAPVRLSPQRMQQIGVTTAIAELKTVSDDLRAPGNVDLDEQRLSYVQTRFPGWIQSVFANATYQYVRKGQPLFTIYSPDLVSSEQEYLLARKNQAAFSQPMEGHEIHGTDSQESGWLLQAAEQRLEQFGVTTGQIASLDKTGKVERNLTVYSPVSGYITERNALPNAYVQPDTKIYSIADLSTVWVYANVYQGDVGRLRPGDAARVSVDAYPGREFKARIDQILPQVDQSTRTVKVRLIMANPALALKPGMYVNVDIAANLARHIVVPASAVLQSGQNAVVFIDHGEGHLEPRVVTTGPQVDESTVILSGIKPGERVVSSASFLVDSEAQLQAAFQNFAPLEQPAGANAAPTNEQVQIAFDTQPSPPRKGGNTLRVKLTANHGEPAAGLHVTVVFFMPAMPAMGMAAQHASATLTEKSAGIYDGPLQLPSGGTFQVTITATRDGKVVATKQLSVDATGGM
jgi:RND family efflux transporter MFP subunit